MTSGSAIGVALLGCVAFVAACSGSESSTGQRMDTDHAFGPDGGDASGAGGDGDGDGDGDGMPAGDGGSSGMPNDPGSEDGGSAATPGDGGPGNPTDPGSDGGTPPVGGNCLQSGGALALTTVGALALDIDTSDDSHCLGTSIFGADTWIRLSIPQDEPENPILVTIETTGLNPGGLVSDHPITLQFVTSGNVEGQWTTSNLCTLDVTENEMVAAQPTLNRVEGSVTCSSPIASSSPEGELLTVQTFEFATAVSRGS